MHIIGATGLGMHGYKQARPWGAMSLPALHHCSRQNQWFKLRQAGHKVLHTQEHTHTHKHTSLAKHLHCMHTFRGPHWVFMVAKQERPWKVTFYLRLCCNNSENQGSFKDVLGSGGAWKQEATWTQAQSVCLPGVAPDPWGAASRKESSQIFIYEGWFLVLPLAYFFGAYAQLNMHLILPIVPFCLQFCLGHQAWVFHGAADEKARPCSRWDVL